jgi:hypothetical protein
MEILNLEFGVKLRIFSAATAAAALGAIGSASAQTNAECSQDYVAKAASRGTQGQTEEQFVNACHVPASAPVATPESRSADTEEESQLAKKTQNPIGDLISLPFQNNSNFGFGPHRGTQDVVNIQPVIPIHVTSDWNIITRTILPLVSSPNLPFGTAPTSFSAFLSPSELTNGWLWGFGPVVEIPTISNSKLGSSVWGGGPTAVIVYTSGPVVAGALANNIWSFGGSKGPGGTSYDTFLTQPFFNYNFDKGWYVGTSPIITSNWQANGEKWTLPLGGNVGRIIRIGNQPLNLLVGSYYNALKPTSGGKWQLRTQVTLIF